MGNKQHLCITKPILTSGIRIRSTYENPVNLQGKPLNRSCEKPSAMRVFLFTAGGTINVADPELKQALHTHYDPTHLLIPARSPEPVVPDAASDPVTTPPPVNKASRSN